MALPMRRYCFDDVSAFNRLSPNRRRDYIQIGRGPFRGILTKIDIGSASAQVNDLDREIVGCVRSAVPTVFIAAPIASRSPSRMNGHSVTDKDFVVHWGEDDKVWHTGENFVCRIIELPAHTAPGHLPFSDPEVHTLGGCALMMRCSGIREELHALGRAATELAAVPFPPVPVDGFITAFIAHSWAIVERCCRMDINHASMLSMPKRMRVFRAARDLIHRDEEMPLNVAQLARELAMSERTLSECFRSAIGRSPRTYLRLYRLNRAREYILSHAEEEGNVVTAAAMRCGFWHLGRFSAYYRDLFGELPSDTASAISGHSPGLPGHSPRRMGQVSVNMR